MNHVRPHKLKRDPGVERGENPLALFLFYHTANVVTMRSADRSGKGPCDRGGQAQRQQGLRPPALWPVRRQAFGPQKTKRTTFASPALPIMLAWVKGSLRSFFTPFDPMRKRSGQSGRRKHWSKGWVEKMVDPDQGKGFLEWVFLLLRLFRELRELFTQKEKTPLPPQSSKRKRR